MNIHLIKYDQQKFMISFISVMSANDFTDTCYLRNTDLSYKYAYLEKDSHTTSVESCQEKCIKNKRCRVFTYHSGTSWLIPSWYHASKDYTDEGYTAGWKGCKFTKILCIQRLRQSFFACF